MSSQLGETHELPSDQGDYELNGKGEKRERGRGNEETSEEELSIKPRIAVEKGFAIALYRELLLSFSLSL